MRLKNVHHRVIPDDNEGWYRNVVSYLDISATLLSSEYKDGVPVKHIASKHLRGEGHITTPLRVERVHSTSCNAGLPLSKFQTSSAFVFQSTTVARQCSEAPHRKIRYISLNWHHCIDMQWQMPTCLQLVIHCFKKGCFYCVFVKLMTLLIMVEVYQPQSHVPTLGSNGVMLKCPTTVYIIIITVDITMLSYMLKILFYLLTYSRTFYWHSLMGNWYAQLIVMHSHMIIFLPYTMLFDLYIDF